MITSISGIGMSTLDQVEFEQKGGVAGILAEFRDASERDAMVLATCRRLEVYRWGSGGGEDAARHLFRVCSGLDSAVVGETEIVAQIKRAWELAREAGTMGPRLDLLLRYAMQTSKRVRTETDLCRGVVSYAGLAVREASALARGLGDKSVLILGAGLMAERVLKELRRTPPRETLVISRTYGRAQILAGRFGAASAPLEELNACLKQADIVFGSTAVPLDLPTEESELAHRVSIDLGEPACLPLAWHHDPVRPCVTLDQVIRRCQHNSDRRQAALVVGSAIVEEELARYHQEAQRREARR